MKKTIQQNRIFYLILFIISIIFFIIMCSMADMKSLWMDDIAQIDISWQPDFSALIKRNIELDNNPPLTHLLSFIWIRLVPYGTGWLKLMNIILVTLAAYIIGLLGKELHSNYCGIIAAVLFSTNYGNVASAGYTFRPYGMFVLLGAITFYLYLRSRKNINRKLYHILFTLSLILLVFTHYFGVLLCIAYFCCDLYLFIHKKYKWYYLYSYPVTAILLIPWLLKVMSTSLERLEDFWPTTPSIADVIDTCNALMGYDKRILILLEICFMISVIILILARQKNKLINEEIWSSPCIYFGFTLIIPIIVMGIVFIYSNLPTTFSALFVYRYFLCIVPMLTLVIAVPIATVISYINLHMSTAKVHKGIYIAVTVISILLISKFIITLYFSERSINQPFQETADFLYAEDDILESNVLVFNTCTNVGHGWDYYITHKGQRPAFPVTWYTLNDINLDSYQKVYVVTLHYTLTDEDISTLEDNGFHLAAEDTALPIKIYSR